MINEINLFLSWLESNPLMLVLIYLSLFVFIIPWLDHVKVKEDKARRVKPSEIK